MSQLLSLPPVSGFDAGGPAIASGLSLSDSVAGDLSANAAVPKFPHTRAQLSAIARQHKPLEGGADAGDAPDGGDEFSRVSSSFVSKVVNLLDEEHEDELKTLLKSTYGMDDETVEQNVLDLMHKHRDDIAGVPFLFLTPTRRPISRPSSRASTHSARLNLNRPDTPTSSAPSSPLAMLFKKSSLPVTSPLSTGSGQTSYVSLQTSESPIASPILPHGPPTPTYTQLATSLPASPLSSPRLLNAKASEFKPIPRPLSAASSNPSSLSALRGETPSPDLWAHSSPRAPSNLAIAAPLIPDQTLLARSLTPSSSLRASLRPDDEDEDDPFDPFAPKGGPASFHSITVSDFDAQWSASSNSNSSLSPDDVRPLDAHFAAAHAYALPASPPPGEPVDADAEAALLTDGMTPFDVLSSVFGATLAPSELEDALAANAYDFEAAMAWLVDRARPAGPPGAVPAVRGGTIQQMGGRVTVVPRDVVGAVRGGRAGYAPPPSVRGAPRYGNGRPLPGGNRVCRYFVAGECLRADCRFSHDLERALCRFWLRGTCAKQDSCEFLHHLPKDFDVSQLTSAMTRASVGPPPPLGPVGPPSAPADEFPALGFEHTANGGGRGRGGRGYDRGYHDPSRTRFAAAVKKPVPPIQPVAAAAAAAAAANSVVPADSATLAARREAMGASAESLYSRAAIVAPRASPRLKLRPPALLPTLPTGESVSALYMAYRARALQLGAARNACLSRAADAWRRGDGAAAKRFSREGHDLNAKMAAEMAGAAGRLVRERAALGEAAVRARDAAWSDDLADRAARGRVCGGGLGVILGVASKDMGDGKLTPEERTEAMLDLHGLHSNEATEVLEEFLLTLERDHFYGLAYAIVGEEKHTGTQDAARGTSRQRLATGVREWVHRWGYPWSERDGIICIDPLTHG